MFATALKPMIEPLRELVAATQAEVERGHALGREVKYEAFEGNLTERLAAVERGAHESSLSALDVDAPKILIGGELHVRVIRDKSTYMSQAGGVPSFDRSTVASGTATARRSIRSLFAPARSTASGCPAGSSRF